MKLKNTKKTRVTKTDYHCDFCDKFFQRETTLVAHCCETKRRWQSKEEPGSRIGFQAWLEFYKRNVMSKTPKTFMDFAKSSYYTAFVKFGNYCIDIKCINVSRYADWLLTNSVKLDNWCSDQVYDRFLVEYLRTEDPIDAVARSIETSIYFAEREGIKGQDFLRYGNKNRICTLITNGKISPWMLYQSDSGIEFLDGIDSGQQRMILDYINPEQWALKFHKNREIVAQVKTLLHAGGY